MSQYAFLNNDGSSSMIRWIDEHQSYSIVALNAVVLTFGTEQNGERIYISHINWVMI